MAKARPMNSVAGGSKTARAVPTREDLEALDGGGVVGDRLTEGGRLGHVDIGRQG